MEIPLKQLVVRWLLVCESLDVEKEGERSFSVLSLQQDIFNGCLGPMSVGDINEKDALYSPLHALLSLRGAQTLR